LAYPVQKVKKHTQLQKRKHTVHYKVSAKQGVKISEQVNVKGRLFTKKRHAGSGVFHREEPAYSYGKVKRYSFVKHGIDKRTFLKKRTDNQYQKH